MGKASVLPTSPKQMRHPVLPKAWDNVGDFWNDPRRWDDVDPFKECFWAVRRPDVIDVRVDPVSAMYPLDAQPDLAANVAAQQAAFSMRDYTSLLNVLPGSIIRYRPPLNF